jgi:probable HAF family extracellular repeat protein
MTQRRLLYFLGLSFTLSTLSKVAAQDSTLTTIDFPGATQTQAWGVNAYRDVVGIYTAADTSGHAFLFSAGQFTKVDYPDAALSGVYGINDHGEIVGLYASTPTGPHHGYLIGKDRRFVPIDYPGAASTEAAGINNQGDITGLYTLADGSTHGFLRNRQGFVNIDYPGTTLSFGNGIGRSGDIVGNYFSGGVVRGYLLSYGYQGSIEYPGATFTGAYGIDPEGNIVGRYRDAANVTHGYRFSAGKFTTIDIAGATFTGIAATNMEGDIAGRYVAAGVTHAFLVSQAPTHYTLTDLGTLPGGTFSQAAFIGNNGVIAGLASTADGTQHAVLWQQGRIFDLAKSGAKGLNSGAFGINGRGQALLQAESSSVDQNLENFCAYGTGFKCLPFLWQNGVATQLPTLGGNNGTVGVINNAGEAVGLAENGVRDPDCPVGKSVSGTGPQALDFEAVIWGPRQGEIRELRPLRGDTVGVALGINDSGQATGASGSCANTSFPPFAFGPHAVLWEKDGSPIDLGSLGGTIDFAAGIGHMGLFINNAGHVVGASALPGNKTTHGFLWTRNTGMRDLGTLPGDESSVGLGINESGEVVGASFDADGNPRGFLWQHGAMTDFNTLIPAKSPLYVLFAGAINAKGEIAGFGSTDGGDIHAFVATPDTTVAANERNTPLVTEEVETGRVSMPESIRALVRQRMPAVPFGFRRTPPAR